MKRFAFHFLAVLVCLIVSVDANAAKYSETKNDCFWENYIYYHIIGNKEVEAVLVDSDYAEMMDYWYPADLDEYSISKEVVFTYPETVEHDGSVYTITRLSNYKASDIAYDSTRELVIPTMEAGYCCEPDLLKTAYDYSEYSISQGQPLNSLNGVTKVVLPATLEYIGNASLAYMDNLKEVDFASAYSFLTFGEGVFYRNKIKSIHIPEGTYKLGTRALGTIPNVYLPSSLKVMESYVINSSMKKVSLSKSNKRFKLKNGLMYSLDEKTLYGASGMIPSKVTISSKTNQIKPCAFAYSKVKEVKFKFKFQTKIPEGMFVGCKNLTRVSGIKELKYIEYGAFAECSKLKSIGNPTVLYMIKRAAFWNTKKPKFKLGKKAKSDKYSFKKRKLGKDE